MSTLRRLSLAEAFLGNPNAKAFAPLSAAGTVTSTATLLRLAACVNRSSSAGREGRMANTAVTITRQKHIINLGAVN